MPALPAHLPVLESAAADWQRWRPRPFPDSPAWNRATRVRASPSGIADRRSLTGGWSPRCQRTSSGRRDTSTTAETWARAVPTRISRRSFGPSKLPDVAAACKLDFDRSRGESDLRVAIPWDRSTFFSDDIQGIATRRSLIPGKQASTSSRPFLNGIAAQPRLVVERRLRIARIRIAAPHVGRGTFVRFVSTTPSRRNDLRVGPLEDAVRPGDREAAQVRPRDDESAAEVVELHDRLGAVDLQRLAKRGPGVDDLLAVYDRGPGDQREAFADRPPSSVGCGSSRPAVVENDATSTFGSSDRAPAGRREIGPQPTSAGDVGARTRSAPGAHEQEQEVPSPSRSARQEADQRLR